jgi:pentatricopeptide repeat protein
VIKKGENVDEYLVRYLSIMQERQILDDLLFTTIMAAFGSTGEQEKMIHTFHLMSQFNIVPTAHTFGVLIKYFSDKVC